MAPRPEPETTIEAILMLNYSQELTTQLVAEAKKQYDAGNFYNKGARFSVDKFRWASTPFGAEWAEANTSLAKLRDDLHSKGLLSRQAY